MSVLDTALLDLTDLTDGERKLYGIPMLNDADLETQINEASGWIENETRKAFVSREIEDEEYFNPDPEKIFLHAFPVTELTTVIAPDGTEIDVSKFALNGQTGILHGDFSQTLDANGYPAPWKISYTAGKYEDRAAVPPALKKAAKLVIAWRWRLTPEMQHGDMVPMFIRQALSGFYSSAGTCWG